MFLVATPFRGDACERQSPGLFGQAATSIHGKPFRPRFATEPHHEARSQANLQCAELGQDALHFAPRAD
eukprot:1584141-Alexandrium_andersonii.AAC.1